MFDISARGRRPSRTAVFDGLLLSVLALTFIPMLLVDVQTQSRVRMLQHAFGEPISSRLLPDDEIVVIEREFDTGVLDREPTATESVRDAVERADLIAVVDVIEVSGILVEEGAWIRTRLVGTVRDVLYSKDHQFARGQRVEMEVNGGEMRIGKVLVRADPLRLPAHRRCLLLMKAKGFAGTDRGSMVAGNVHVPLLIEHDKLVSASHAENPRTTPDPLSGLTLSAVKKLVSRVQK